MTPRGRRNDTPVDAQYISGNYPVNLYGPPDTRNETWGNAEAQELKIQFTPPVGKTRTRILGIRGDVVAWPSPVATVDTGALQTPATGSAGVLLGFSTTSSKGSKACNFCADGCMVYIQSAITNGQQCTRAFDYDVVVDGLLDADNILVLKLAAWLNTTGVPIHVEGTYGILFQFE